MQSETVFFDPISSYVPSIWLMSKRKSIKFPSLFDNPSVTLSVIIPAYNERLRLPKMLDECIPYLKSRSERDK